MANFLFNHELLNQINQKQTDDRENEIKRIVIVFYELTLQSYLNQVGEVLNDNRSDSSHETDQNA